MTNECFVIIAKNIKSLRKSHGITQSELAGLLNIDPQYYARLERADDPQRRFTLEKVMIICSLFKVTPNEIITKLPDDKPIEQKDYRYLIESSLKDLNPVQLERVYKEAQRCLRNQREF